MAELCRVTATRHGCPRKRPRPQGSACDHEDARYQRRACHGTEDCALQGKCSEDQGQSVSREEAWLGDMMSEEAITPVEANVADV